MDRHLAPEARKEGAPSVLFVERGVTDVDRAQRLQFRLDRGRSGHAFLPAGRRVVRALSGGRW